MSAETVSTFLKCLTAVLVVSLLFVIALSATQDRQRLASRIHESNFESYLGICERAGHTVQECLFASHYPEEAKILRGSN